MKTLFGALVLVTTFIVVGCGDKAPSVTAPVDYIAASVKAEQSAVKTIDVTSLNKAVELFNTQEGRLPKSLDELVTMKYVRKLPDAPVGMKLSYDATAGKVSVVKQ